MTKARDLANIISGGFTVDDIPNIPASKITSGTFADERIADLSASKLTGSIADARLPATALNSNVDLTNLSASNLTSGTIPTARITALPTGVGGKVLQIVHSQLSSSHVTSSDSFVDTGLTADITISSGSKILCLLTKQTYGVDTSSAIWKGASYGRWLLNNNTLFDTSHIGNRDGQEQLHNSHYSRLITGQSAGTHTIKLQHARVNGGTVYTQDRSSITLMEIA